MSFEYIRGTLTESSPSKIAIEINGLGYGIHIPLSTYDRLPQLGTSLTIHIATIIREDSHTLYGFLTRSERDFFHRLNNISGIGPKLALAIIGHMSLDDLAQAIHDNNSKLISRIPGIGKKTAERMIIELRDKALPSSTPTSSAVSDAVSALINLGYSMAEAHKAVKTAQQRKADATLTDLITMALKAGRG